MQNCRFHPRPAESESAFLTTKKSLKCTLNLRSSVLGLSLRMEYNLYFLMELYGSRPGWQMDMMNIWDFRDLFFPPSILSYLSPSIPFSLFLTCIDLSFYFCMEILKQLRFVLFFPITWSWSFHLWFSQFSSKLNIKQICLLTVDPKLGHAVVLPAGAESWANKGRGETGWSQVLSPGEVRKLCLCLHISQTANSQTTDNFWKAFL